MHYLLIVLVAQRAGADGVDTTLRVVFILIRAVSVRPRIDGYGRAKIMIRYYLVDDDLIYELSFMAVDAAHLSPSEKTHFSGVPRRLQ